MIDWPRALGIAAAREVLRRGAELRCDCVRCREAEVFLRQMGEAA